MSSGIVIRDCNLIVLATAWSTWQNLHKLHERTVQITINYYELSARTCRETNGILILRGDIEIREGGGEGEG